VLWIPLIVTSFVAVVKLGLKNTDAKVNPQWKTDFIPESNGINYPDVTLQFVNPDPLNVNPVMQTISCTQRASQPLTLRPCPPPLNSLTQCAYLPLSQFSASRQWIHQNHVACNITIVAAGTVNPVNQALAISIAQGYVWFANPPTYVNPTSYARLDMFREVFIPLSGSVVYEWGVWPLNPSSIYNTQGTPFIMRLDFDIPFRAITQHVQFVLFDDYQLLGAWGGFFFFCAFLHAIVFAFVKLYTPADSKLLGNNPAGPSYESIK